MDGIQHFSMIRIAYLVVPLYMVSPPRDRGKQAGGDVETLPEVSVLIMAKQPVYNRFWPRWRAREGHQSIMKRSTPNSPQNVSPRARGQKRSLAFQRGYGMKKITVAR
jgi:hypothetical protein